MTMFAHNMTEVQCRILAVLEESGELDIIALTNTVGKWNGDAEEIAQIQTDFADLIRKGFLHTAVTRNENTLHWEIELESESLDRIARLHDSLQWDSQGQFWEWYAEVPRLQVLLSDRGQVLSRELLAEHGWRLAEPQ